MATQRIRASTWLLGYTQSMRATQRMRGMSVLSQHSTRGVLAEHATQRVLCWHATRAGCVACPASTLEPAIVSQPSRTGSPLTVCAQRVVLHTSTLALLAAIAAGQGPAM